MDKYCIKMLSIINSYEESRSTGIGITVLDRKFYEVYSYDETMVSSVIEKLKEDCLLLDVYPYRVSEKGRELLKKIKNDREIQSG